MDPAPIDLARAPAASSAAVRDRFRRQGRRDTAPELALRRRLHARGVRFRVDVRPGRATRARGDLLTAEGWRVLRFWEHEDPDAAADEVCRALGRGLVTEGVGAIP